MFEVDPPFVYDSIVREFLYSFVSSWEDVPRHKCTTSKSEREVVEWKFRLGGVDYTYLREDLLRAFDMPNRDKYPYVRRETLNEFWTEIYGSELALFCHKRAQTLSHRSGV